MSFILEIYIGLLEKYEEINLSTYTNNRKYEHIISEVGSNTEIKEKSDLMLKAVRNPFEQLYHWIKGELHDIRSLNEAISGKEELEKHKIKLQDKKKNTQ